MYARRDANHFNKKISGIFAYLGNYELYFYRLDGILFLNVNKIAYYFNRLKIQSQTLKKHIDTKNNNIFLDRKLLIYEQDKLILESYYVTHIFYFDFTMIDDEDLDFGLFLEKISLNLERQAYMFYD